jgi:kynurenine formamidase
MPENPFKRGRYGLLKIIDLTIPITHGMPRFPRYYIPSVELQPTATHEKERRSIHRLVIGTHNGTHIDAPFHMVPDGTRIDEVPLESLIGRAIVIDLSNKEPRAEISSKDLMHASSKIRAHDAVLIRTDWDRMWGRPEYFTDQPYLATDCAEWLIERRIRALGVDFSSVDNPSQVKAGEVPLVHRRLLENSVLIIECLANLRSVTKSTVELISLPLKIVGSDGAPARIVAIE